MVENMNRNGEIIKQPKMQILAKTRERGFTFNFVLFEYEVLAIHFWCMYAIDMGGFSLTQLFSSQGTGFGGVQEGQSETMKGLDSDKGISNLVCDIIHIFMFCSHKWDQLR